MSNPTAAEVAMGDALLDAIRARAADDELSAALLAIPAFKADPIAAGAFLLGLMDYAIRCYADHCRETPQQTVARLWSKPGERS